MPICVTKRLKRTKLCSGDLTSYIAIEERVLQAPLPGQSEPQEVFTLLKNVWAGKEEIRGINRFFNVNIEEGATDFFFIRDDPDLNELDSGNYFVHYEDKYYRILRVETDDYNIVLQCVERGLDTQEATEA